VHAWSAGSHPKDVPHPMALELLGEMDIEFTSYRSKSWDEFAEPQAPEMDIVITVCDSAAGESCPVWPGAPVTGHWGIADPAAVEGEEQRAAFETARDRLTARIERLLELPIETMDADVLGAALAQIGALGEGATDLARKGGQA